MNSYLIIGGTPKDRFDKINSLLATYPSTEFTVSKVELLRTSNLQLDKPHPDLLSIQPDPSVRIRHIREAQKFLSRKPYQAEIKAIVIAEAEKMTIPAQNAFLKTLEEPPEDSLIFLCSPNEELLLPTIVSRCEVIRLTDGNNLTIDSTILNTKYQILNTILKAKVGERLKLIEPYEKTREEALKFCEEMIIVLRSGLVDKALPTTNPSTSLRASNLQLTTIIKSFQQAFSLLQANINVKLVMDNLVIDFLN